MTKLTMKFDFQTLPSLLGRRADDPRVIALIGGGPDRIETFAQVGYVAFKEQGVSVMFREAGWLFRPSELRDPRDLHLSGFHFHRAGHDGHSEYSGQFPGGVCFGDTSLQIE